MSAEVLRRAAALMRERAEAADRSPWKVFGTGEGTTVASQWTKGMFSQVCAEITPLGNLKTKPNAEHIASWHPAVAVAVADWLDEVASMFGVTTGNPVFDLGHKRALAVARAYLREAS